MLSSEPYLYHSVVNISNVLKVTQIIHNHYYVIVKTGQAESLEVTPKIMKLSSVAIFL